MTDAEKIVAQYKAQPRPEPTLAQYIAAYIEEEQKKMAYPECIDSWLIQDAINAYMGGAR